MYDFSCEHCAGTVRERRSDREVKLPVYALAGIADYWIVNLIDEQVEVYRKPSGRKYQEESVYRGDASIHPVALHTATLQPSRLFGE